MYCSSKPAGIRFWDSRMRCLFGALALAVFSASVCLATGFPFFEPLQPPRPFQAVVHRGESKQAPENTRSALQLCIEDGLEWAEVDVQLTRDGQHILSHDGIIMGADGKSWKISDYDWTALREVEVGSHFAARFAGERLLSLNDCLRLCKGKLNLQLDCKAVNPEQLAREILDAGMERQVIVYSDVDELRQVQQVSASKVATMAKWQPGLGGPEWAVTNGLAAVEVDAPELSPAVREAFGRAGIKVEAKVLGDWDKSEVWEKVMAAGADWLQTDLPEEVLAHALWRRLPKRPVEISLHRGAKRYAPENTLPAFAKAVRLGADYVEFDVRTTQDGAFFLLHDSKLDRTTDGSGPIDQATADVFRKLSAGVKFGRSFADVRVPSLEEFLEAFAGKVGLYFDAKAIPPATLAEALKRHKILETTVVYQSPRYLAELKEIDPEIRGLAPLGRPEDLDKLATGLKPYAVDADWDILSKELIARCHTAGIRVFSDALGDHERIEDYLLAMEWGIDLIQTDHPLRVMRAIELRIGGRPSASVRSSPPVPGKF